MSPFPTFPFTHVPPKPRQRTPNHRPARLRWSRLVLLSALTFGVLSVAAAEPSIARVWDEEILKAIRIDKPHPPVHARNLFSLSAAMYDAWAAYDTAAVG